jgi:hypothetical protein
MTVGRERRYVLDSNLSIRTFRAETDRNALDDFPQAFAPFCVLPTIVTQTLLAGVRTPAEARVLAKHPVRVFAPAAEWQLMASHKASNPWLTYRRGGNG